MTNAIEIPGASAFATTRTPSAPTDQTSADKDTFLKLLVAQMKYQDPTSPTDPAQFLSQMAQFTQVEKLTDLTTLNQQVYDASRQQTATSMIGRTVTWTDVTGNSRSGLVTGASVGASTPNLTVGGSPVSLDDVVDVSATASTTGTTAGTATTTGTTSTTGTTAGTGATTG